MLKNFVCIIFAVIIAVFTGCAGVPRGGLADAGFDGIALGAPVRYISVRDGNSFIFLPEGTFNNQFGLEGSWTGVEGVSVEDFTSARYLVVRLREIPSAAITLAWGASFADGHAWWNPARIMLHETPGARWDAESMKLWIQLSQVLADYDRFLTSADHVRLYFPAWGTGDGGVFGADYIIAGWLVGGN